VVTVQNMNGQFHGDKLAGSNGPFNGDEEEAGCNAAISHSCKPNEFSPTNMNGVEITNVSSFRFTALDHESPRLTDYESEGFVARRTGWRTSNTKGDDGPTKKQRTKTGPVKRARKKQSSAKE
jgi:hypothetical protein